MNCRSPRRLPFACRLLPLDAPLVLFKGVVCFSFISRASGEGDLFLFSSGESLERNEEREREGEKEYWRKGTRRYRGKLDKVDQEQKLTGEIELIETRKRTNRNKEERKREMEKSQAQVERKTLTNKVDQKQN